MKVRLQPHLHDTPHIPLLAERWFPRVARHKQETVRTTSADKLSTWQLYFSAQGLSKGSIVQENPDQYVFVGQSFPLLLYRYFSV